VATSTLEKDKSSGMTGAVVDKVQEYGEYTVDCIQEHPFSATLVSFAVGVGAGLLAVSLFSNPRHEHRNMAQRLGEQFLSSLQSVVPDRFK
jgi:hypothetical protein